MAEHVEVVIKIPKYYLTHPQDYSCLAEGHGRLIDADAMWDIYHSNDYDFYEALDDALTIIEADKAESEET